jgi:hypothetical protein
MSEERSASSEDVYNPESVRIAEKPRGFYELLEAIHRRPAMYLGRKSFHDFHCWLGGYRHARWEAGIVPTAEEEEFQGFDDFVQQKFRWHDVGGWAAKIAYYHRDDAAALDEFFILLDEFRDTKQEQRERKSRKRRRD